MDLIITKSRGSAVRIYYKPTGLSWNKQKMEAVAGLQFLHLELHLHMQHLSVAQASKLQCIIRRCWCRTPDRILHLAKLSPRTE